MPVSAEHEDAVQLAIERLVESRPLVARDCSLLDRNLLVESGLSRATMYRCKAMNDWRKVKEDAVVQAMERLRLRRVGSPDMDFTDALLVSEARIDHKALRHLPEDVLQRWNEAKTQKPYRSRRESVAEKPDEVIDSLVNKLFGVTLALTQAQETIRKQAAEIERLGGNVVPIRPA